MRTFASERRRAPRFSVSTQVELVFPASGRLTTDARNLSILGVYVSTVPQDLPGLQPGSRLEVVIAPASEAISCPARVVRRDPGREGLRPPGLGIVFDELSPDTLEKVRAFIVRASRPQGAP